MFHFQFIIPECMARSQSVGDGLLSSRVLYKTYWHPEKKRIKKSRELFYNNPEDFIGNQGRANSH